MTEDRYIDVSSVDHLLRHDSSVILIDARTPEEYDEGHVPGAINVPIAKLVEFAKDHGDTSKGPVITLCGSTGRGEKAATILDAGGMKNVQVMKGGLKAWREAGLPVA